MELEKSTMRDFINYLKEHGYPENSLATEYLIGEKYRVDLIVIDPVTNIPIMIFELKARMDDELIVRGKDHLMKILEELDDLTIPAYLVFPKEDHPYFELRRVNLNYKDEELNRVDLKNIDYKSQRISRLSREANQAENKKKRTIDVFGLVTRLIAGSILILIVARKAFQINLDTTDLALIGGVIILTLLPFADKIKFYGVEFERYKEAKHDDRKTME